MSASTAVSDTPRGTTAAPVCYQLTNWDLARLAWVHPVWSRWLFVSVAMLRGWVRILRFAAKPLLAVVGTVSVAVGLQADSVPMIALGIVLLMLLPIGLMKAFVLYQLRRSYAPRGMAARHEVQATQEALVWRCDGRELQIPWRAFHDVYDLPGAVLLHAPVFGMLLLPKRAFADRSAERAFVVFAAARRGERLVSYGGALPKPNAAVGHSAQWLVVALVLVAVVCVVALAASGKVR